MCQWTDLSSPVIKLQALEHSPLCKAAGCWVKPASSSVCLPCRVRELHRLGTLDEIAQFPSFSVGREGRAAWWNFKHSATLSRVGISQEPWTLCAPSTCKVLVEIWAPLLISDGSSALLEILGPVPLSYSTSPGWWPDQRSLNLVLALLPSTL